MYYLGVDLGGTNIVAGICNEKGEILTKASSKTRDVMSPEGIAGEIARLCFACVEKAGIPMDEIETVGIGTPGIANSETGVVEYSCNLDFHDVPLASMVAEKTGKKVLIENDANAAALGEYAAGAGKDAKSLVAITLGTGVGGGIIINDRLLTGFNHAGAELGHIVIEKGGVPCNCGRRGCFEAYASATALIRITKEKMASAEDSLMWQQVGGDVDAVDGRTAFDCMRKGDKAAEAAVGEFIENLACGITSIVNIFQPEIACVGGGISNEGETLLGPVRKIVDREEYARDCKKRFKLVKAQLGNDAGLIGAALLPLYR